MGLIKQKGKTMLNQLREANNLRQLEWPGNDKIDIAFRALEVAGETGELSESVKKFLRAERGIKGSTATKKDVANEMADAIIAIDLLANEMGINLSETVAEKFNHTSQKYGLQTRLEYNPVLHSYDGELGYGDIG